MSSGSALSASNRCSPGKCIDQIIPSNVSQLKQAWVFHTGTAGPTIGMEMTPLVVNGVMYVERESKRTAPRYSIDALRSIGPVGHRHINFRGTYQFPVERYADRLVASAA
jgi:hypothetical protein